MNVNKLRAFVVQWVVLMDVVEFVRSQNVFQLIALQQVKKQKAKAIYMYRKL